MKEQELSTDEVEPEKKDYEKPGLTRRVRVEKLYGEVCKKEQVCPDGTGPHGKGMGPGKGKSDGSGLKEQEKTPGFSMTKCMAKMNATGIDNPGAICQWMYQDWKKGNRKNPFPE